MSKSQASLKLEELKQLKNSLGRSSLKILNR
jgi:hypothetical protein